MDVFVDFVRAVHLYWAIIRLFFLALSPLEPLLSGRRQISVKSCNFFRFPLVWTMITFICGKDGRILLQSGTFAAPLLQVWRLR